MVELLLLFEPILVFVLVALPGLMCGSTWFVALGVALGVALTTFQSNWGGLDFGVALGVALGAALAYRAVWR